MRIKILCSSTATAVYELIIKMNPHLLRMHFLSIEKVDIHIRVLIIKQYFVIYSTALSLLLLVLNYCA